MTTRFTLLLFLALAFSSASVTGQTTTPTPAAQDDDAAKKTEDIKITEVVLTDSLSSTELVNRAVNWVKVENPKYKKLSGATTGSKVECSVNFPIKPKELNPETDYTGKITMKVTIECKDNRYKFTISQIRHVSKSGKSTGGAIENVIPECGSMSLQTITWKKIKGEALRDAQSVVVDLKAGMFLSSADAATEDW